MCYTDETTVMINNLKMKTWQLSDSAVYSPRTTRTFNQSPSTAALAIPVFLGIPFSGLAVVLEASI